MKANIHIFIITTLTYEEMKIYSSSSSILEAEEDIYVQNSTKRVNFSTTIITSKDSTSCVTYYQDASQGMIKSVKMIIRHIIFIFYDFYHSSRTHSFSFSPCYEFPIFQKIRELFRRILYNCG
jgi:hypothetical protein